MHKLMFGKHKGTPLAAVVEIDPNYCRWLDAQPLVRGRISSIATSAAADGCRRLCRRCKAAADTADTAAAPSLAP